MSSEGPDANGTRTRRRPSRRRDRRYAYLLLLMPFIALLAVPLYAREEPALLGWPFFYWYQFVVGAITIALMAIVYRITRGAFRDEELDSPQRDESTR